MHVHGAWFSLVKMVSDKFNFSFQNKSKYSTSLKLFTPLKEKKIILSPKRYIL